MTEGPLIADLPALEYVEQTVLGGSDARGAHALGSVRSATFLSGRDEFAIVDGMTQEIRVFSWSGAHIRTLGGKGGGPGEFLALHRIGPRRGGGLCAWDVMQRRLTEFDDSGRILGTARPDLSGIASLTPRLVGFVGACSFVLEDRRPEMDMRGEPEGMRSDTVGFVVFGRDGRRDRDVGTVVGPERWFRNRDRGWGWTQPIFGAELFAFVVDGRLWTGSSDSLRWTRTDLQGTGVDTLRLSLPFRAVSSEDVRQERQRRIDSLAVRSAELLEPAIIIDGRPAEELLSDHERTALVDAPASDRMPAYDRAVAGPDGALWLRVFPRPASPDATWLLLLRDGSLEGRIELPRTTRVLAGTRTALLLLEQDAMEAAVIRILRRTRAR